MDGFKKEIEQRRFRNALLKEIEQDAGAEEDEANTPPDEPVVIAASVVKPDGYKSPGRGSEFALDIQKVLETVAEFPHEGAQSLTAILRDIPYESRSVGGDEEGDGEPLYDPEYDDWDDDMVTDEDGDYGFVTTRSSGSHRPLLKLYRLLPERESRVLQLRSRGYTFDHIGGVLGVSHARAQQIWEQAQQRFFENLVRLRQGESAAAIMAKADRLSESARKKSEKLRSRQAIPFTNTPECHD